MVDHSAGDLRVFETGSIMLYLCEYYDKEHKLLPAVSQSLNLKWVRCPRAVMCMCNRQRMGCQVPNMPAATVAGPQEQNGGDQLADVADGVSDGV